ncbi:Ubiquitin carboxyl-terminal hydrolase 1 [Dichanthelium oligosanthes]|uniref:Ubiquitin carboxyl-terminal hydrolase 1 n=1 Tax=Dichanthelium oligosanthes TaxID=888268 RepID=A0A1E5WAG6_9POAL|nr:Ubiquitin carboxyl-terminal hydrolase 1 [Dichanthelium oligosanthes]
MCFFFCGCFAPGAMGKKTPPKGEPEGSPRKAKAPRLDLDLLALADVALVDAASAPEASNLMEEGAEGTSGNNRCNHVLTDSARTRLSSSLLSEGAGTCVGCRREDAKGPRYRKHRPDESSILMCLECGRHLCCGVGGIEYPFGHSRAHAMKKQHWVAVLHDDAERGYCFNCNAEVGMPAEFEVDGYAIGIDVIRDVVSWLPKYVLPSSGVMRYTRPRSEGTGDNHRSNLGDKKHSHEFGSASRQGYAIRGIPNNTNTCYMNAILQCLLALDKLRARLLAPDDMGLFALALAELFEETSAAGDLLDPKKILACVRMHNRYFEGGGMHDSHELLLSLRDGLNEEDMEIKNLERQIGAPTFINSIFGFELSQKLSCKCGLESVSHPFFYDLPLPLPSKGHPTKSVASVQTSECLKSRQKNIAIQLFPANEQSNLEKMQTAAEGGDSHLLDSELKEVIVEETPKPLEVGEFICAPATTQKHKVKYRMLDSADSTEAQRIYQSMDVVQHPLQNEKSTVSSFKFMQRISNVPVKSFNFLPREVSDVKVEEMNEMTTDSVESIEDCLSVFSSEQVIEWQCDNCRNEDQMVGSANEDTTVARDQIEQSYRTTCQNEQSSVPSSLSVECKSSSSRKPQASDAQSQIIQTLDRITDGTNSGMSCEKILAACSIPNKEPECHEGIRPAEKQTDLLRTEHSEGVSKQLMMYQETMKQLDLYSSACQLKDGKNEQNDKVGDAIQTRLFNKLPPVLTLHLERAGTGHNFLLKNSEHVRFKEYLDVGRFMDPSGFIIHPALLSCDSVVQSVMGDTRPREWEAGESSRDAKTPRLDLLASTASALEVNDLQGWEEWPDETGDNDRCNHVPTDSAHRSILDSALQSDDAGKCAGCQRSESVNSRFLVCLECGRQSCGDSATYIPYGHAQDHAKQEQHWVAAMFADPQAGFCFKCDTEVPVYPEEEEMTGEIQAGGHAFGFDVHPDLVSGLLNFGDTWHDHELGSANVQGYAIRGIPNRGCTCYVNAIVQCLLVLDRLQARMFGPDSPPGQLGLALMELFEETSVADAMGSSLDPDKLLRRIRLHADKFVAYKMHDSYELLQSLLSALHSEENGIEAPNSAPTVIDSIFRGELSYTRSCIYCGFSPVYRPEQFSELSLPLPSKEHPSRSAAAPQISESLKSQPKKAATQLIPADEKSTSEKIRAVAKNGDSHLLDSELKDVVVEKTPGPLEVDSSEAQCLWQSEDVIQDPLETREDKVSCSELSRRIIEAPPMSVSFVPHNLSNANVEQVMEMTTDSHSPEDMGPPPLVAPLSENGAPMTSGSSVDQNDNADPGDLLNQLEVSVEVKENTVQFTAEDKGNAQSRNVIHDKEGVSNSVPSIEDCLSLFFKEQVVERNCDDCSKVLKEPSTNQSENGEQIVASTTDNTAVDGNQIEQSDRLTCQIEQSIEPNSLSVKCKSSSSRQPDDSDAKSEIIQTVEANTEGINSGMSYGDKEIECHGGIQEAVSSCLPAEKQNNLLSPQHSQNLSTPNQDRRNQLGGLDLSASQSGDNQIEQKERSGCAIQTLRITKLPPVLTLHLKRYIKDGNVHHKSEAHPCIWFNYFFFSLIFSSVDKDKSLYRLAGVVEHRGGPSMDAGHYVAYVRARRLGNQEQQSSCSSSWFCADDSYIREIPLEEVLKREAYILFYEKMEDVASI